MTQPASVDVIGTIYRQGVQVGTDPETGTPVHEQIARSGWHVNAIWTAESELPQGWAETCVTPEPTTPKRVFAGADDYRYFRTYHRFTDEASFLAVCSGS